MGLFDKIFTSNKDITQAVEIPWVKLTTIGQLDEEALFYLRTRGIPIIQARGLLTYAFANNVLDSVKIPKLKSRINQIISTKLEVKIRHEL